MHMNRSYSVNMFSKFFLLFSFSFLSGCNGYFSYFAQKKGIDLGRNRIKEKKGASVSLTRDLVFSHFSRFSSKYIYKCLPSVTSDN